MKNQRAESKEPDDLITRALKLGHLTPSETEELIETLGPVHTYLPSMESEIRSSPARALNVAVFGAASPNISKKKLKQAHHVGELIASWDHRLIFGAGMTGIMGAVARGYASKNPSLKAFGSTTSTLKDIEDVDHTINLIERPDMAGRKELYQLADIVLVMPGGFGTCDELFEFLTYKQLSEMARKSGFPNIRLWDGKLLLWKGGASSAIVALWDAMYKQKMAPDWREYVTLVDSKDLYFILSEGQW